jgi:GTP-binding protein Era
VTQSGFVALAGRPNVGKSTLINAVVGSKIAIVSDRPQTTRRAVRGVYSSGEHQLVFVDLPGVQRPRDALTARMAKRVEQELYGADAALLVLAGEHGVGPGERFIAARLADADLPVTVAVNKIDRLSRAQILQALQQAAELQGVGEVFPISARTGEGLGELVRHLAAQMPDGPFVYDVAQRTDQPPQVLLAELVREAVLRRTFQEVPHAVEVLVEEIEHPHADLVVVRALIWVESESQKRIVVGAQGRMIKAVGTAARRALEDELGSRVHLQLSVRVRRDWRAQEELLDRLGI